MIERFYLPFYLRSITIHILSNMSMWFNKKSLKLQRLHIYACMSCMFFYVLLAMNQNTDGKDISIEIYLR